MINLGNFKLTRSEVNGKWKAIVKTEIEIPDEEAQAIFKLADVDVPLGIEMALRKVFLKND